MKKRNPAAVFFLCFITLGIYIIVWLVKTKNEMNKQGTQIPTAWIWIIPFVGLYWSWKYSEGVEKITGGKVSAIASFLLIQLLGPIGMAIVQSEFNKLDGATAMVAPLANGPGPAVPPANQFAPVQPTESVSVSPNFPASPAQPSSPQSFQPTQASPVQPPVTTFSPDQAPAVVVSPQVAAPQGPTAQQPPQAPVA
ncbi:MAG TPA: DUF4234 domain-containing protein [Candidatus Saccharimonadales bacterium]|nr:DUF4234 domain-containing protein [Candidatus Saccharimonadales bacterium]